jgi:hypothetical protein
VHLGQLEVVVEPLVRELAPRPLDGAAPHLLVPPLARRAAVPVGDADERVVRVQRGHAAPVGAQHVRQPHRRALLGRAHRVAHCRDVQGKRLGQAGAQLILAEVDEPLDPWWNRGHDT